MKLSPLPLLDPQNTAMLLISGICDLTTTQTRLLYGCAAGPTTHGAPEVLKDRLSMPVKVARLMIGKLLRMSEKPTD